MQNKEEGEIERKRSRSRDHGREKLEDNRKAKKKDKDKKKHSKKEKKRRRRHSSSSDQSFRSREAHDYQEQKKFDQRLEEIRKRSEKDKSHKPVEENQTFNKRFVLNKGLLGTMLSDNIRSNFRMDKVNKIK